MPASLLFAYSWKLFQNCLVFLIAVQIPPVGVVEIGVELAEYPLLFSPGNGHVVLHCVQSSQDQVEDTYGWSGGRYRT